MFATARRHHGTVAAVDHSSRSLSSALPARAALEVAE
jgi:hypothetical protein